MVLAVDEIDSKALRALLDEGRISWTALAEKLGLSAPAAAERVRKLEESGIIRGYTAILNAESLGVTVTAMVFVTLERPSHRAGFLRRIEKLPEVQECHHLAGEYDYLLKVRCRGMPDLERVISQELKGVAGILRTNTNIVLSTLKETGALPLR